MIARGGTVDDKKGYAPREKRAADPESSIDRAVPCSIEAEEGFLACCIMDGGGEVLTAAIEAKIAAEYFFKPNHQIIFQALLDLYRDGSPVDEIILADTLQNQSKLEEVGGYVAISQLTNRIETTAHYKYWLDIVREKYLLRRLISTSSGIIEKCYDSQGELEVLLENAEQEIFKISQDRITESAKSIKESVDDAVNLINTMLQRQGELSGLPSGFVDLDKMTFGFHPQEMIVLAARPSVGKTSFAMNIAENVIFGKRDIGNDHVLVFSLEMGAEQLAMRMLCSHSRVNMKKLKDGFMSKDDQRNLARAAQEMKGAPLLIDDSAQTTILEMRAKARRIHSKTPLNLIVIDYLQLISGTDSRTPREQQIAEISRGVKAMAKELRVPVIVLSQLNRDSEKERRAPRLSDLRESGSIEQDADVVLLLAKKVREDDKTGALGDPGERDLIIAKQRNGPVGNLNLSFIPELTRFENYIKEDL